ncbi:hypothetical protein G7K_2014-t1 [Saitoella complicata NRRL Y-17804]|uniref:Uncharacterized protein n=1 Tax=Saitoella complicata (strain BCRC 22490 / CBS 7301 / JCM 7358 / NBRC 10748 / NRRL Y-17804) TaxID=698492 RepID=A0A0E9NDK7_SAICN|nr:hypothetical protein G7K_2014-t1 [Saitoella complicata NRRL Y-17804]
MRTNSGRFEFGRGEQLRLPPYQCMLLGRRQLVWHTAPETDPNNSTLLSTVIREVADNPSFDYFPSLWTPPSLIP